MNFETIIGLEVHAQLVTKSKMFCHCSADYASASPNTHVCPVCLGMPGVLPTINRQAVEYAVMTALALCTIGSDTEPVVPWPPPEVIVEKALGLLRATVPADPAKRNDRAAEIVVAFLNGWRRTEMNPKGQDWDWVPGGAHWFLWSYVDRLVADCFNYLKENVIGFPDLVILIAVFHLGAEQKILEKILHVTASVRNVFPYPSPEGFLIFWLGNHSILFQIIVITPGIT